MDCCYRMWKTLTVISSCTVNMEEYLQQQRDLLISVLFQQYVLNIACLQRELYAFIIFTLPLPVVFSRLLITADSKLRMEKDMCRLNIDAWNNIIIRLLLIFFLLWMPRCFVHCCREIMGFKGWMSKLQSYTWPNYSSETMKQTTVIRQTLRRLKIL